MTQLLSVLSYLGVIQGFILALILYARRKENAYNGWLALLFAFFSAIILLITISNRFAGRFNTIFEVFEYGATFLAGPFIYLFSLYLLRRSLPSKKMLTLHFSPFLIYVIFQSLSYGLTALPDISIIIPLLHFQLYTLWLVTIVWREVRFKMNRKEERPEEWLVLMTVLLVCLHISQWLRYLFSGIEQLSLIVPLVAFGGFYLLGVYGLFKSRLFVLTRKYKNTTYADDELAIYKNKLLRLFEENEIHIVPDLTLEQVGYEMGVPPHVVSRLINDLFGTHFNAFVNAYRVESAKKYLKDPANSCYTIEALAERAGFNSRSAFYSSFRKITHTTPSTYRD